MTCGMRYIACHGMFFILCFFTIFDTFGQEMPDTTNRSATTHQLNEVEVKAVYSSAIRATSPLQVLRGSDLQKINALQVSDAIKFFSGVQVKDYGGIGGLKTVSIRSLGANHTTVAYDGITLTDYQTGQIDLGRFSLDNVEMINLTIGENDDIFQTARMQALAGAINIVSRKPQLTDNNKPMNTIAGIKAGSFGFINPFVVYEQCLNKVFSTQISGEWMKTDGNYPFIQYYGNNKDSSEVKKRTNSEVERLNLEANLFGKFANKGNLSLKLYYYNSDRKLPGPVKPGEQDDHEQATDENFFVQSKYEQIISEKIKFQANAKFNFSYTDYLDYSDNYIPLGKIENTYYQREYYLNVTAFYQPVSHFSFSLANDGSYGNFSNNFYDCPYPSRLIWQSALSGKFDSGRFMLNGSLLNTAVWEQVEAGKSPGNKYRISPYLGFSWKLFEHIPFRFRGFYKNIFRLPTFGDLYYGRIGNRDLNPESVNQYDLGVTWASSINNHIPYFSLTADIYYNQVKDKIVATPKNGLMIWSIENLGKVEIKGVDVGLNTQFRFSDRTGFELDVAYTYQEALNKTDASKRSYNQQLAYTPKHSGSVRIGASFSWFDINYTALFSGKRYDRNYNISLYQLDAYIDQSISLSKYFTFNKIKLFVSAECLNVFDEQYQVVKTFPLPGRSYKMTCKFTY